MVKSIEVLEPIAVKALREICFYHPESNIDWECSDPNKVVVSGQNRLKFTVEEGRLVRLDLSDYNLKGNINIRDLPTLEHLTISEKDVSGLEVNNLQSLHTLILDQLTLFNCQGAEAREVLKLANLPKLATLKIRSCQLCDVKPLSLLTSLTSLDLSRNQIQDVEDLSALKSLVKLDLAQNSLAEIAHLRQFSALRELDICDNNIRALPFFKWLPELRALTIGGAQLKSIKGLAHMKKLEELKIEGTFIEDITSIKNLTSLKRLQLSDNRLRELKPLEKLVNLQSVDLSFNTIEDISALSNLKRLTNLVLHHNLIFDLAPLEHLLNLKDLDLSYNSIIDISALKNLPNLQTLNLNSNEIFDFSSVDKMKSLKFLNYENNDDDFGQSQACSDVGTVDGADGLISPGQKQVFQELLESIDEFDDYLDDNSDDSFNDKSDDDFSEIHPKFELENISIKHISELPETVADFFKNEISKAAKNSVGPFSGGSKPPARMIVKCSFEGPFGNDMPSEAQLRKIVAGIFNHLNLEGLVNLSEEILNNSDLKAKIEELCRNAADVDQEQSDDAQSDENDESEALNQLSSLLHFMPKKTSLH
jgi:internalin A